MLWPGRLWTLAVTCNIVAAISLISIKGTKLYDEDGNQFFVRGVVYRGYSSSQDSNGTDVLVNTSQCQIDAGLMKQLGINTVRVYGYSIELGSNHDGCMQAFANQDIYVWLDIDDRSTYWSGSPHESSPDYTLEMFNSLAAKVDLFAKYDNILTLGIGNEVLMSDNTTSAAPYIKAAIRDVKAFRDARGYRSIPIAYSSTGIFDLMQLTADYLTCGDTDDTVDIYGLNIYSWCSNSSYYESGYDGFYEDFQAMDIPVLFSETGCNAEKRDFSDVDTILGPVFQAVFSGAIVYEWVNETSGFGIVEYSNGDYTGFPVTLSDYNALQMVLSTATPAGTALAEYSPSNSAPDCPASTPSTWMVDGNADLPTIANLDISTVTARTTLASRTSSSTNSGTSGAEVGGQSDNGQHSLSTGAIVGIAVAGVVLGLAIIIGALIVIRKRRASREGKKDAAAVDQDHSTRSAEDDLDGPHQFKPELPATSAVKVIPRQELAASQHTHNVTGHDEQLGRYYDVPNAEVEGTTPAVPQTSAYELEGSVPDSYERRPETGRHV